VSDLSKVPFLANLDASDLQILAQRMEKRLYDAGDLIYADGTPGEGLYFVESGTVTVLTNVSCDGEIMAHLPKGSTFGETSLLNDRPRTTATRAATDCTIMLLPRSDFQAFLAEHPAAGQVVTQSLLQRPPRGARQLVAELLKPMPLFSGVKDDALLDIARKLQRRAVP
jgi:CRP/FNR family transcriptional regulator